MLRTYGRAVVLHEVLRLDPEGFEEIAVRRIEPGRDWEWRAGLHTFNLLQDRIVIDAKREVTDLLAPLAALRPRRRAPSARHEALSTY